MQELTQSTYNRVKLWVIFVSKPVLRLELKDQTSYLDKSCIINKFNRFCEKSFTGQRSRHLKTRVNELIPKCVLKFIKEKTFNKTKGCYKCDKKDFDSRTFD